MAKASWNGQVIAESDSTVVVEGNHYFPRESLHTEFFHESDHSSTCPWKGRASYFDVEVDGKRNLGSAWTYNDPKPQAEEIKGYVAFWRGVTVDA